MVAILDSHEVLAQGVAALTAADSVMARLVAEGAAPPLRKREPGFEGLVGIVVSQQLSVASASAIFGRLKDGFPSLTPEHMAVAPEAELRACGLSAPKIRALRSIAEAVIAGRLPLASLHEREADEAHRLMTGVKGIGPWTADIYLLFCLGHGDAFPAGDLALQEAARLAYGLAARPTEKAFIAMAEPWRPWRGIAAKILWAHYRLAKARDGAPVQAG